MLSVNERESEEKKVLITQFEIFLHSNFTAEFSAIEFVRTSSMI